MKAKTMLMRLLLVAALAFGMPAQAYVGNFIKTFQEFSPHQKTASFGLDQVMEK
jgi:arylsulfatase